MPRFAANLAYLFAERPFMERFGAAAASGFKAVELQFPYDHAPSAVKAELARHGLTMLGLNTAPGREGEFGLRELQPVQAGLDRDAQRIATARRIGVPGLLLNQLEPMNPGRTVESFGTNRLILRSCPLHLASRISTPQGTRREGSCRN